MVELYGYDFEMRRVKSRIFADCFVLSGKDGYDSTHFITTVMNSSILEDYGDLIYDDERQEWSCGIELLYNIVKLENLVMGGIQFEEYELWFMGYLYKYWMRTTGERPDIVFRQLPVGAFRKMFGHYHTQSWDYIIEDAKKMHSRGEW